MPLILNTPEVETKKITKIVITEIVNSPARGVFVIRYNKLLENGEVASTEAMRIRDKDKIKAFYDLITQKVKAGKTFEEASRDILYNAIDPNGSIV